MPSFDIEKSDFILASAHHKVSVSISVPQWPATETRTMQST